MGNTVNFSQIIRTILTMVAAILVWPMFAHSSTCFEMGESLKEKLGIEGEYDPRLRVERKTTNTNQDAKLFLEFIRRLVREGESMELRDVSSNSRLQLVTSTNYPFSKEVFDRFNVKVRVREYGERLKGSKDPFNSTTGKYVSLEIKAKLPDASRPGEALQGVVVKPILKTPKSLLKKLFTDRATFEANKEFIIQELVKLNAEKVKNVEAVVREVVADLAKMHALQAQLTPGQRIPCNNVEYQREAYVLLVKGPDGKTRKVQFTFDRAVTERANVDPTLAPVEIGKSAPTGLYPPDAVVIEMKTDLWLNDRYVSNPLQTRHEFPTYALVRRTYEKLQELAIDGFTSDSGKASHFRRKSEELRALMHYGGI